MTSILTSRRPEIAIDFGTANVRVIRRDDGIVFDEPSLCCFSRQQGTSGLVAAGAEAHAMVDRTPTHLQMKHPLCRGVLQDIDAAKELLRYAMSRAGGRKRLRAPRAIFGVPADATQAERNAMLTAADDAGFGATTLVAEPLAAAIGAQLPVQEPAGSMIIECGAGTTEVAVFSLGGLCETGSVRIGGATLNRAIADQLHLRHKFLIGDLTAEQLKLDYVGRRRAPYGSEADAISVRGRCLRAGLPMSIEVELSELDMVVKKHIQQVVSVVRDVLGRTAPEISQDIHDRGVVLTGGGALMPLMSEMIAAATGLRVEIAEQPTQCVAYGLHRMLAG
ncbi:MAG: rod shape-determining protein [Novosphingobium sp.]